MTAKRSGGGSGSSSSSSSSQSESGNINRSLNPNGGGGEKKSKEGRTKVVQSVEKKECSFWEIGVSDYPISLREGGEGASDIFRVDPAPRGRRTSDPPLKLP